MKKGNVKVLLMTVGGTKNPIIYSLNTNKPEYVIFFASKQTEGDIADILAKAKHKPKYERKIIIEDASNFKMAIEKLKKEINKILNDWKIKKTELNVDYTGGTKAMVGAAVFATSEYAKNYIYIGGERQNKDKVKTGTEKLYKQKNPYIEFALEYIKEAENYFSKVNYNASIEMLEKVINNKRNERNLKAYYESIKSIIEGFREWDLFNHKRANDLINKGINRLSPLIAWNEEIEKNLKPIKKLLNNLLLIVKQNNKRELIKDLIANAKRRGDIEGKYDDAVARLYSALEKIAKYRLLEKYNINTSDIDISKIPSQKRNEYERLYGNNQIKIGLYESYDLLKSLGDDLGNKFFLNEKQIKKVIDVRNSSILAHGDIPVKKHIYESLLKIVMDFAELSEKDLPKFPSKLKIILNY